MSDNGQTVTGSDSAGSVSKPLSAFIYILPILALALGLRLWGITWALPNAERYFSYHVDESVVVTYSRTVNPLLLLLDPGFYNYGSLSLLLNGLFIHLGEWVGLVTPGPSPQIYSASALLVARLVTVALGTATCGMLYGAGRLLYGRSAGILAALLYAVAPLAVQHGHFATVDVPATFWVTGSLYFAIRHISDERRSRDLLYAGIWAGLAAATKYNMVLVAAAGIAAWFLVKPRDIRSLFALIGGVVGGFLVGCPGILLNPQAFFAGLAYEANHVREGHGMVFTHTASGFIFHLGNLISGLTFPLLIFVMIAFFWSVVRRKSSDIALLAFVVPYYVLIGLAEVKFTRYTLPLFPPLFLFVAALFPTTVQALNTIKIKGGLHPILRKYGSSVLVGLGVCSSAFYLSFGLDSVMTQTDPRDKAATFIRQKGFASVGFATGPWFNSPPLNPLLTAFAPPAAKKAAAETQNIRLIPADGEWNLEQLKAENPEAVSLSELNEYADAERIQDPKAMAYIHYLLQNYPHHEIFANPVSLMASPGYGLHTPTADYPLPSLGLPHDMNYTNPTTIVFYK